MSLVYLHDEWCAWCDVGWVSNTYFFTSTPDTRAQKQTSLNFKLDRHTQKIYEIWTLVVGATGGTSSPLAAHRLLAGGEATD